LWCLLPSDFLSKKKKKKSKRKFPPSSPCFRMNEQPAPNLIDILQQLVQRLDNIEQNIPPVQPNQPQHQPQQPQNQPQLANQAGVSQQPSNRSLATDFGFTPEQIQQAWRDLSDRVRSIQLPSTATVNTTKPRGASSSTKVELDYIAKYQAVARVLLQLFITSKNPAVRTDEIGQACLIAGLHLLQQLQTRQGDIFVASAYPEAFDTYRDLRSGPSGIVSGEELTRLTTAIQLTNLTGPPRKHRSNNNSNYSNSSNSGNYNNHPNHYQQGHRGRGFYNYRGNQRNNQNQNQGPGPAPAANQEQDN